MKPLPRYIFFFSLLFFAGLSKAQDKKVDSLLGLLNSAKQDTVKLNLYFKILELCDIHDNLKYGEAAEKLCNQLIVQANNEKEKNKFLRKKADALNFISFYYQNKQDVNKRIKFLQKRQAIFEQMKDTLRALNLEFDIADICRFAGNLPEAFEHFKRGLALGKKWKNKKAIVRFMAELGDMYSDQGDTSQAVQLYKEMLNIALEVNEKRFLALTTMKVGGLYNAMKQYAKALDYYEQSGSLFEEIKEFYGRMEVYKNTGDTYKAKGDFKMALQSYESSVQMANVLKEPIYQINCMSRLAATYGEMKDYKSALRVLNDAMLIDKNIKGGGRMTGWLNYYFAKIYFRQKEYKKAKVCSDFSLQSILNNNGLEIRRDAESLAASIDSACGDFKGAYLHHLQYVLLRDKMNSEEIKKEATKERFQAAFDMQKAKSKAEQEKKDLKAADEKQQQQVITWFVVGCLLLAILFAIYMVRSLYITRKQKQLIELKEKETQKQNEIISQQKQEVEEKQKEIVDSLKYARRIQRALITNETYIRKSLNKLMK